jgi:hypothetical protein
MDKMRNEVTHSTQVAMYYSLGMDIANALSYLAHLSDIMNLDLTIHKSTGTSLSSVSQLRLAPAPASFSIQSMIHWLWGVRQQIAVLVLEILPAEAKYDGF